MKKPLKVIDQYKLVSPVEIPHNVWRCFGSPSKTIDIGSGSISLGEDFLSLEECRAALEWYVDQLGGSCLWTE